MIDTKMLLYKDELISWTIAKTKKLNKFCVCNKIWFINSCKKHQYIKIAEKVDIAKLKSDVDKLDTYKLETIPVDLGKLGNVVKSDVVKKNGYIQLFKKFNAIQTIDTNDLV